MEVDPVPAVAQEETETSRSNVIESPGKGGQVEQRQGTQGKEIDVYVDEMVARKQASRGSASNKSMRQNFGAQEQLIRR